ncbi:RagB/SusD family nutrient uptake outer membrane protein [Tunicatimonas pelagia]|uniref:RagB/SusD family nutrient uptake outer membrane protein n=1 Tax=Tunicatimonas pelagia TaxID=931531 RepID=UPI002665EA91|nr:RagB/SusD family nutrient uptake outer membrane protein [Tunicatimonas pelagia]WKN46279.1 RagB/SusD family nutrient uptake outer membrane protein [Tunicatimonas pelagia]
MKNIMYRISLIFLLFGGITACEFLEIEPVSEITSANFFQTEGDAEAALIACYDALQSFTYARDIIIVSGVVSDEAFAARGGNYTRHEGFVHHGNHGNIRQFWQESYETIQRTLDVTEQVPTITDPALTQADKDRIAGEALFIRALSYFNLTRWFGRIPIVPRTTKSPEQELQLSRSEVSEVLALVISELQQAETLLPEENGDRSRAERGAAQALLARVYLWRNNPGDYDLALAECDKVLNNDRYRLIDGTDYASMFAVGEQNAAESIFEISYRPDRTQEGHALDSETIPAQGTRYRVRPDTVSTLRFTENDIRRTVCVDSFENNYYIKKYESGPPELNTNRNLQDANIIVLRLADIILMKAECLNELGRTGEAIPLINQIRERAGLAPTTAASADAVRQAILDERFLELYFEGQRWFDLVRTGLVDDVIENLPDMDRVLWPVPTREIDINPNLLPQNSGF